MSYGLSFAAIASLVVYTYLHHGKLIWRQYKNSTTEKPDIHMKLMRKYKEAPDWWYYSLFWIVSDVDPAGGINPCGKRTNHSYIDAHAWICHRVGVSH